MNSNELDFMGMLNTTLQDSSNSLALIGSILQEVTAIELSDTQLDKQTAIVDMIYENARVYYDVLHLHHLYQFNQKTYQLAIEEVFMLDFINERLIEVDRLLKFRDIQLVIDCADELIWYFDTNVIRVVVSDMFMHSAQRAQTQIKLSVKIIDDQLHIRMEDDSSGIKKKYHVTEEECRQGASLQQNRFGLTILHAIKALELHRRNFKRGYITIDNDSLLGGSAITVVLP